MVFDTLGDLWVSNFSSANPGVFEFSPTGSFMTVVTSASLLVEPFGLALGPDGNIYVADFGGNNVAEIDTTNDMVSNFISNPSSCTINPTDCLVAPKYLTFADINVPEPGSLALFLPALLILLSLRVPSSGNASGTGGADLARSGIWWLTNRGRR
jgi:streptogramin lyase